MAPKETLPPCRVRIPTARLGIPCVHTSPTASLDAPILPYSTPKDTYRPPKDALPAHTLQYAYASLVQHALYNPPCRP